MARPGPAAAGIAAGGAGRSDCGGEDCALATSGVGRPSLAEGRTCGSARGSGAAVAGMPPAAAVVRPSLLASRRSGEGPAGGGVDGIAIPGMGRRVATVEAGPADAEVRALPGSAPARSATFGWPATDSLGLPDSPNESDSLRVAWDTLARAVLGRVSASLAGPAAGGATAASGVTSTLAAGGRAAFAAGTSGPALAASGGTSGWALSSCGGIGAAFGAGVDRISDAAAGGTSGAGADWGFVGSGQTFDVAGGLLVAGASLTAVASDRVLGGATGGLGSGTCRALAAGATLARPAGRASRAGGTSASATGRALTARPGGTWALGGGSLTSGTGGFFN